VVRRQGLAARATQPANASTVPEKKIPNSGSGPKDWLAQSVIQTIGNGGGIPPGHVRLAQSRQGKLVTMMQEALKNSAKPMAEWAYKLSQLQPFLGPQ
jgi:hypothetical protein